MAGELSAARAWRAARAAPDRCPVPLASRRLLFGLEVGALNHLHARCNYALSARFTTQEEWNVFYRESLGKLKHFCRKDGTPPYCEEAMRAEGPR